MYSYRLVSVFQMVGEVQFPSTEKHLIIIYNSSNNYFTFKLNIDRISAPPGFSNSLDTDNKNKKCYLYNQIKHPV